MVYALEREKNIHEKLNGKLVAMAPRPFVNHTSVAGNIYWLFRNYLKDKKCNTFTGGIDVHLTKDDTVVPDVMIVCNKDIIKADGIYGTPDLIVEVLSPSTAKRDKGYKKDLYQRCGVKEYWITDTANKLIEIYLLKDGQFILDEVYALYDQLTVSKLTDEEKAEYRTTFNVSLFDDLTVDLNDVFDKMIEDL